MLISRIPDDVYAKNARLARTAKALMEERREARLEAFERVEELLCVLADKEDVKALTCPEADMHIHRARAKVPSETPNSWSQS